MGKFYEHLSIKGRIGRPDGALLRITGDRNIPLMNALLGLYVEHPETLFPKKDSILFSKDGSVGIAYKLEEDAQFITSSALLQLTVRDTKIILPDYLTLVLNSPVVQLQAERAASGAVIQHWKPSEIQQVIIPVLDMPEQRKLSQMVQQSFSLRRQSEQLLDCAKHAVELAIEQGEDVAIEWLKEKGGNG